MKVAIAGNPNCGKTSIFNSLVGAHRHVGNYPGVTVEKQTGFVTINDISVEFIDLPGTYSLTAYAEDELIAREFLINEKPDLIINVIDTINFERNLNLTVQLLELEIPLILVLNMFDLARDRGIYVDTKQLQHMINAPIVPCIGHKKSGLYPLREALTKFISTPHQKNLPLKISYGVEINALIQNLEEKLNHDLLLNQFPHLPYAKTWMIIKLVEGDPEIKNYISQNTSSAKDYFEEIAKLEKHLSITHNDTLENIIGEYRMGFANSLTKSCMTIPLLSRKTVTDKLDLILTNKVLGPLSLLMILGLVYHFTFTLSAYPVSMLESFFGLLHDLGTTYLPQGIIRSLLVSGVIDGVGGVLSFTPLILFMFAIISFLEDSGYVTRIAFLMDRILRTFGMHGNSILAFIVSGGISGGCAVPGIMATRSLYDKKERLATILTVPFMNCGAKLPVYALLIGAFFPSHQGIMMFLITLLSWFFALIIAGFLRSTFLKGEAAPFIMELPLYHLPTIRGIALHTWFKTWMYVKKAGTFILLASIIMWGTLTFPFPTTTNLKNFSFNNSNEYNLNHSIAATIGKTLEHLTKPITGFDWKMNIALIGGATAKEVIVSTLATAHSMDTDNTTKLGEKLKNDPDWNPLRAFAYLVFIMLYMPCIAVIAVIKKETGSWKWGAFSIVYTTVLAFLVSTLIYQAGTLINCTI